MYKKRVPMIGDNMRVRDRKNPRTGHVIRNAGGLSLRVIVKWHGGDEVPYPTFWLEACPKLPTRPSMR